MSHLIRYKLKQGDILTYDQEVTLVLEEPDGSKYNGVMREEYIQSVTQEHDGWWSILLTINNLSSEGPLCLEVPEDLRTRHGELSMDARGTLLDNGSGGPAPRVPAFPMEGVNPGQSWLAVAATPEGGQPLEIQYYLEKVENQVGEEVATMVTLANSTQPDYTSETQASLRFSLSKGHQINSTTVTKLTWKDGRVSHSVVELKLRERTSA